MPSLVRRGHGSYPEAATRSKGNRSSGGWTRGFGHVSAGDPPTRHAVEAFLNCSIPNLLDTPKGNADLRFPERPRTAPSSAPDEPATPDDPFDHSPDLLGRPGPPAKNVPNRKAQPIGKIGLTPRGGIG